MSVSCKLCSRARNHSFFIWQVTSLIRRNLKDPLIQGSMRQTLNIQLLCSWPHSGSMRRLRKPRPEAVSSFNNLISVCKFHRNGNGIKAQGTTRSSFMYGRFKNWKSKIRKKYEKSKLLAATPWGPGRRQVHSLSDSVCNAYEASL